MNESLKNRKWAKRVGLLSTASVLSLAAATIAPTYAWANLTDGSAISVKVSSPKVHEVIKTKELALSVTASGYSLDAGFAGTPNSATVGHYHEILDGRLVDMTPVDDPNRDTISMMGVKKGKHYLMIVPARNDHSMIMSAAVKIPFTYAGRFIPQPAGYSGSDSSSIAITSPAPGSTVSGKSFIMTAKISNFVVCGGCFGKSLVAGQGHWHIFVDQPMMANMLTMANGSDQQVSLKGITPGVHTFWAVIVDNHHMPFMDMTTKKMKDGTATSIDLNVRP